MGVSVTVGTIVLVVVEAPEAPEILSGGVATPAAVTVTVTAHPLVCATVRIAVSTCVRVIVDMAVEVVVSTCVLVITAVDVASVVCVRVVFVVWVWGTSEKNVNVVEDTAVIVIVVWAVGASPDVGVVVFVAVPLAVAVAFEVADELGTGPMPHSPYPKTQPAPQCSSLAPHQPSGEQQSPNSEPIHV